MISHLIFTCLYSHNVLHNTCSYIPSLCAGHKSSVRSIVVADSEHYFISGSRDKTVKVWSLRNNGPGSGTVSSRLTYTGHQKPVAAVELLENLDSVVSCDGTVHVSVSVHLHLRMTVCVCVCVCVYVCDKYNITCTQ